MPPVRQVLLVCASCLSSGIVTLPAATHTAGFLPAAATLAAVWLCAVGWALLLLEAASVAGERPNMPTMLDRVLGLGSAGRLVCCAMFVATYGTTLAISLAEAGRRVSVLLAVVADCLGTDLVMHCYTLAAPKGPTVRAGGSASPHGHRAAGGAPQLLACTLCLGLALWRGRGAVERWCTVCVLGACLAFGAVSTATVCQHAVVLRATVAADSWCSTPPRRPGRRTLRTPTPSALATRRPRGWPGF